MSDEKNRPKIPDDSNWESDLEKAAQRVGRQELKNRLKDLERKKNVPKPAKVFSFRRILTLAAGFFFLAASVAVWYANDNFTEEKIAERFYNEPNFSGIRGEENDKPFEYAVELFYKKDYGAAFKILSGNRKTNREDFFRGYIRLKMENFDWAIKIFTEIQQNEDPSWQAETDWFLAMTHLKSGNLAEAEKGFLKIKNEENHPFQKKAVELLSELESPWRRLMF